MDWVLDELESSCPSEFAQVSSEAASLAEALAAAPARTFGVDQSNPSPAGTDTSWANARSWVGQHRTVCGPLINDALSDDDVFLNLGRGYPDPDRFTIVLWDVGGIEDLPPGVTVCATGTISLYQGVTQMETRLSSVTVDLP